MRRRRLYTNRIYDVYSAPIYAVGTEVIYLLITLLLAVGLPMADGYIDNYITII